MSNAVWVYRIYDIAEEIDLREVESILSPAKPTSRLRLSRVRPKSIHIENPPVTVELGGGNLTLNGTAFPISVSARIFHLGVVSIVIKIFLLPDFSYDGMRELSVFLHNTDDLEPVFAVHLDTIKNSLHLCLSLREQEFMEDFTVFFFQKWDNSWDPVPILLAEKGPLSRDTERETLKNSFSYGPGDLTIITWDSALVYDADGSTDVPDLLEFATTQLLELRYYDNLLSLELDRIYGAIDRADTLGWWKRLHQYRRIMKNMMEVLVDVTEITERIRKQITVTEDVFYARVYGASLSIFRTREWMESIWEKVSLIQRTYSMLSDEVINRRSTLLELAIVALFVLEVILGLVKH